jgi:hypothetical protein
VRYDCGDEGDKHANRRFEVPLQEKTKASKPLRLPALQFGSKNFSRKRWR